MSQQQGSAGNVIAALCNVFIPGLGHLIQGRLLAAILYFVTISVGYAFYILIIPAIFAAIIHLICIISAARYRPTD
jgi:TM2 domain-containing membrane protein YozV